MEEEIFIEIPVTLYKDDGMYVIANSKKTDEIIRDVGIVVQGETLEEAKEQWLNSLKFHLQFINNRSNELDRWKPFQKGNWKHIGGTWFKIFGLQFYFRYGRDNKYGWFVPFTKLNVSFHNYWYTRKSKT